MNTLYIGFKEFLYADHKNEKYKKNYGCCFVFYWETLMLKTSREFIPRENNMHLEILADNKVYV